MVVGPSAESCAGNLSQEEGTMPSSFAKSTIHIVQHIHPLPVCGDGHHDRSCKPHGPEIACLHVRFPDPNTHKIHEFASCIHLFR